MKFTDVIILFSCIAIHIAACSASSVATPGPVYAGMIWPGVKFNLRPIKPDQEVDADPAVASSNLNDRGEPPIKGIRVTLHGRANRLHMREDVVDVLDHVASALSKPAIMLRIVTLVISSIFASIKLLIDQQSVHGQHLRDDSNRFQVLKRLSRLDME